MHRDYGPKNVKFYFIYKSLAHPELAGDYVQPFTLSERLAHAQQAERQLGTSIPWIVDTMDNRLKHALGNCPNSEFIIDPNGTIVRKRAWSHPSQVRDDLEVLVGPVDEVTREEDVHLKLQLPLKAAAPRGTMPRLARPRMQPLVLKPNTESSESRYFAKLRAEADSDLLSSGSGKLYLGFHLDPFLKAHWNNLTPPLSFRLEADEGVKLRQRSGTAPEVETVSDSDPREFLIDVEAWPADKPVKLTVRYYACVGEESCHTVTQEYILRRERDPDGGGARGEGAGFWDAEEFAQRLMNSDRDRDGRLTKSEVPGIVLPHFDRLDADHDGTLSSQEVKVISNWLNSHHQPGTPGGTP